MKNKASISLFASAFLLLSATACGPDKRASKTTSASSDEMAVTNVMASSDATVESSEVWPQPDPAMLPEGPHKDQVLYGEALIRSTYEYVGPDVADPNMRYAGNHLACGSCHQDAGRQRYGLSFIGVADAYPRDMARENEVRTLTQRINGCFERSMNGRTLPADSPEIAAMIAYIGFLSEAAPPAMDGRGAPALGLMDRAADPARGAQVYSTYCSVCHGVEGQGAPQTDGSTGYLYPPLWGLDSFNNGAGMHRIMKAASFIRANMPFGVTYETPILTEEEAFDVAAFINVQPRPEKAGLDQDYPDRTRKPVDAPFPPYADDYSQEQHKFGPWKEMIEARKAQSAN
jgi:thiosulfate dehydrogenase